MCVQCGRLVHCKYRTISVGGTDYIPSMTGEKMKDYSESTLKDFQALIAEQQLEIERLTVENNLLRSASESHRELNGNLRIALDDMLEKYTNLNKFVGGA